MSEAAIQRATAAHREWNRQRQAETVSEQRARMAETAEELSEIEYLRDDPAPARSEHTPREIADFLIDEVLDPFPESSLYDDYQEDYESRDGVDSSESVFNARYDEGVALLRAVPDLLEALEELLASTQKSYIPKHNAVSKARAALAKAKGEQQ